MTASSEKRRYFNELASRWDNIPQPEDAGRRVAAFCRLAVPPQARRILDAGCGTGLLALHILEICGHGRVVELDFAIEMLRQSARKRIDDRIERVCADALALPFPDACFDAVMCFGILPHLGAPGPAVRELWRVLRRGGSLAVGHLMGSEQLNLRHREIGGPVGNDRLLGAGELAAMLLKLGAVGAEAEDVPERYFVRARK